jgi:hypothetical protein
VSLGCTNRQVAEKKLLRELLDEREHEAAGLIAPKVERDAANKLLDAHLDDWIATKERMPDDQYMAGVRGRVLRLIEQCEWRYARDAGFEPATGRDNQRPQFRAFASAAAKFAENARIAPPLIENRRTAPDHPAKFENSHEYRTSFPGSISYASTTFSVVFCFTTSSMNFR